MENSYKNRMTCQAGQTECLTGNRVPNGLSLSGHRGRGSSDATRAGLASTIGHSRPRDPGSSCKVQNLTNILWKMHQVSFLRITVCFRETF